MMATIANTALWFLDTRVEFLSQGDDHGLLRIWCPPGDTAPLHRHDEDETFVVLDGEMTFVVDGETHVVGVGGTLTAPQGVAHAFRITSSTAAEMLVLTSPGRFASFVRDVGRPADDDGLPEQAGPPTPEQAAAFTEAAARYGIEILGPPPFAS